MPATRLNPWAKARWCVIAGWGIEVSCDENLTFSHCAGEERAIILRRETSAAYHCLAARYLRRDSALGSG